MSEGGIDGVAALMDRLDHCFEYQMGYLQTWEGGAETPTEVLQRNFWWCVLDDKSAWATRHRIGIDHLVVESDKSETARTKYSERIRSPKVRESRASSSERLPVRKAAEGAVAEVPDRQRPLPPR